MSLVRKDMKSVGDLSRLSIVLYGHHYHVAHDYCENDDFKLISCNHIV